MRIEVLPQVCKHDVTDIHVYTALVVASIKPHLIVYISIYPYSETNLFCMDYDLRANCKHFYSFCELSVI